MSDVKSNHTYLIWLTILAPWTAIAGPVLNGNFETGGLSPWVGATDPSTLRDPKVTNGAAGGGINGPSGSAYDDFAVLDTTLDPGNIAGQTWWSAISQSNVTYGGVTGTLEFRLTDPSDPARPTGNYSALLLDNIAVSYGASDTLSFNWYALTKKDQARNDYFTVAFNGQEIYRFSYTSPVVPTAETGGGGGNNFGPFTYGSGWQTTSIPVQPVPEPATWLLLACGVAPIAWRRRRRA